MSVTDHPGLMPLLDSSPGCKIRGVRPGRMILSYRAHCRSRESRSLSIEPMQRRRQSSLVVIYRRKCASVVRSSCPVVKWIVVHHPRNRKPEAKEK